MKTELPKSLHTKFGKAYLNTDGYYQIKSKKEGNYLKVLHRLIFENFYNMKIPKGYVIHHKNGNRQDNCILNLQILPEAEHNRISNLGSKHSDETKQKMSKAKMGKKHHFFGKTFSNETKQKMSLSMSKARNTTGYYRVCKAKENNCEQGFRWVYSYLEEGKKKTIKSVDIKKLEQKVKAKGLDWIKFED